MRYKLRAECSQDIICFLAVTHSDISSFSFKRWKGFPDCDFAFSSDLEVDELKERMLLFPDLHVMVETIAPAKKYTGERTYETN